MAARSSGRRSRGIGERAAVLRERLEHRRVRVVDLAGPERLARRAQLVAGAQHADPGPARDDDVPDARGDGRSELGGAEPAARRQHRASRRACPRRRRGCSRPPRLQHASRCRSVPRPARPPDGSPRSRPAAPPRRSRSGSPRPSAEPLRRGRAGAGLADDHQRASGRARHHGVAVHRRTGERRHVARGVNVLGQHPVECVGDGDPLARHPLDAAQDSLASVRDA